MSYNVRYGSAEDGDNSWENRRPATIAMINDQLPDIFGVQEAESDQLEYINTNCTDYAMVGVGRDDGVSTGEHMSVFWNTKTMKMLDWGSTRSQAKSSTLLIRIFIIGSMNTRLRKKVWN